MVDEERVLRLLDRIRADVGALELLADRSPEDIVHEVVTLSGLKYLFITAIEGCAKVAHHIGASQGWPAAETNADAVRDLGRHGVVPAALAAAVADAVGFRNLLVHQYADVDDVRTVGHLDRLGDLDGFVAAVTHWLDSQRP